MRVAVSEKTQKQCLRTAAPSQHPIQSQGPRRCPSPFLRNDRLIPSSCCHHLPSLVATVTCLLSSLDRGINVQFTFQPRVSWSIRTSERFVKEKIWGSFSLRQRCNSTAVYLPRSFCVPREKPLTLLYLIPRTRCRLGTTTTHDAQRKGQAPRPTGSLARALPLCSAAHSHQQRMAPWECLP